VNWSSIFCMFDMSVTRPSLTMQLTSGMDVFAHVCGQTADTSNNYCDNIQPYDKKHFCFYQMWHDFRIVFFWKLPQFHTSNFRKVVWQRTEGMVGSIIRVCCKFTWLSRCERILKICWELTKLSSWVWCTTFLGHSV